jgi:hypothetical protein
LQDVSIVNTHPFDEDFQYARVGNVHRREINVTIAKTYKLAYYKSSTILPSTPAYIEIHSRSPSGYPPYNLSQTFSNSAIFASPALSTQQVSSLGTISHATNDAAYWGPYTPQNHILESIYAPPSTNYITNNLNVLNSQVGSGPAIPYADMYLNQNYSLLALGDRYGRNNSIKIITLSRKGHPIKTEQIMEPNVFECVEVYPTVNSCTNGTVPFADFYGAELAISENRLIVSAEATDDSGIPGPGSKGAIYLYSKKGDWALDKIIKGTNFGDRLGNHVAASAIEYAYSQLSSNSNQGKVFVSQW